MPIKSLEKSKKEKRALNLFAPRYFDLVLSEITEHYSSFRRQIQLFEFVSLGLQGISSPVFLAEQRSVLPVQTTIFGFELYPESTIQCLLGKVTNLECMVSVHCTAFFELVILVNLLLRHSQMKFTKYPLVHVGMRNTLAWSHKMQSQGGTLKKFKYNHETT